MYVCICKCSSYIYVVASQLVIRPNAFRFNVILIVATGIYPPNTDIV